MPEKKGGNVKKSARKAAKKVTDKVAKVLDNSSDKVLDESLSKAKAKKTVKKVSKSRASVKTSTKKAKAKSKKVEGDKRFFLASGEVISDLMTLADAFESMADEVFYYHVNDERNDFSNWVNDVLEEEVLAQDIMCAGNKDRCQIVTLRCLLK